MRLVLHDGGLRDFVPQMPVLDDFGRVRHRLDLGDPGTWSPVEYDGSSHLDPRRLRTDRIRHNWLSDRGWTIRYFTASDLYQNPRSILLSVTEARRSRANPR